MLFLTDAPSRKTSRISLITFLLQHLDCAIHNLLLIPVDAFEGCSDPALGIKDVSLDAVPIHQRLDEVDPELEVPAKRVDTVRRPQHSMAGVHAHASVLPIAAKTFGKIERGIVGNRGGVYLIGESLRLQQLLNPRELRDRERALQRVVAARVEEDDDGGVSSEEFLEGDRRALVILENG